MSFATGSTRIFRFGLLAIAILGFCVVIGFGKWIARAGAERRCSGRRGRCHAGRRTIGSECGRRSGDPDAPAIQQAQDAADAAAEALDSATEARDQLESDGASQDEIDAANQAVAKARFDKENADAAVKAADDAANQ